MQGRNRDAGVEKEHVGIGREGGMRRPGINALPRVNQIASGTCQAAQDAQLGAVMT